MMLRKTLASVLLCSSLLIPGCKQKSEDRMMVHEGAPGSTATDKPQEEYARDRGVAMGAGSGAPVNGAYAPSAKTDTTTAEGYQDYGKNPWVDASKDHLSTFAADVDTASYSLARRKLLEGQLPVAAGVRVEEFVNYFRYAFPTPQSDSPFSVIMDAAPSPLAPGRHIVRVAVATKAKSAQERKPANLVFLVDVSGSMQSPDKLELAKKALTTLTMNLGEGDTVALVTYAGSTRVVLPPTGAANKSKIIAALNDLVASGSTGMASGIDLAYKQAMQGVRPGAISRVIVLSDGDANVGANTHEEILKIIEGRAKEGVTLSTIGFGTGNYKDALMEQLADKGNGNYAYLDTLAEGRKVLVEQAGGTLVTVAKDVKLQVEFNPAQVAAYRLIGYENRVLAAKDFNDDKKDAGDLGAGHTVTALYELVPAGGTAEIAPVNPLKYQKQPQLAPTAASGEMCTVKLRYKEPESARSRLIEIPVRDSSASYSQASGDFKFAAAVASFGMLLRGSKYAGTASADAVLELAQEGVGNDVGGYRTEFLDLVRKSKTLAAR